MNFEKNTERREKEIGMALQHSKKKFTGSSPNDKPILLVHLNFNFNLFFSDSVWFT